MLKRHEPFAPGGPFFVNPLLLIPTSLSLFTDSSNYFTPGHGHVVLLVVIIAVDLKASFVEVAWW